MKAISWDPEKAEWLRSKSDRNISFERCAAAIREFDILDDLINPARGGQYIFIIKIMGMLMSFLMLKMKRQYT
jgi:hypothetical protein